MKNPIAYIHPGAKIASNVTVEPFAYIDDNVVIEEGSWIGPNACIMKGSRLGKNCKVFPGAVVGCIPQDLKFNGESTTVEIGDNVSIRECVTINRGTNANQKTVVGNNCLLMAYTHIAHDCVLGNNVILANSVNLAGHIELNDFVIVEGTAAIQQFIKVGAHAFIAGGSLVRKDVPPFVKAAREPLSYIGVNTVGLQRRGFKEDCVQQIKDIYRILFVKGYRTEKALKMIENDFPVTDEREAILNFAKTSTTGLMKGFMSLNHDSAN